MALRVCSTPNCPTLIPKAGLCPTCSADYERTRGTRAERGYGTEHDRRRAAIQRRMNEGAVYYCWRPRCGRPIDPANWDLGHDDDDRTQYRGPECPACNRATASRR